MPRTHMQCHDAGPGRAVIRLLLLVSAAAVMAALAAVSPALAEPVAIPREAPIAQDAYQVFIAISFFSVAFGGAVLLAASGIRHLIISRRIGRLSKRSDDRNTAVSEIRRIDELSLLPNRLVSSAITAMMAVTLLCLIAVPITDVLLPAQTPPEFTEQLGEGEEAGPWTPGDEISAYLIYGACTSLALAALIYLVARYSPPGRKQREEELVGYARRSGLPVSVRMTPGDLRKSGKIPVGEHHYIEPELPIEPEHQPDMPNYYSRLRIMRQ